MGCSLQKSLPSMTDDRIVEAAINNARTNMAYLDKGQSLKALRNEAIGEGDSAIVIAAGPSLARHDPITQIKAAGYKGALVATESALFYCLRNGVVPDLIVSLDPHATRIVRWLGDPSLTEESLDKDDYYRRQDMDRTFADELRINEEVLELVNRHGADIRIALSTSASNAVVSRAVDARMPIYWWNPMLDNPAAPHSRTKTLLRMNGMPCVNAGGNVGAACWMMASAVLNKKNIALTGMDCAYYPDTPYEATQYYHEAVALVGKDRLDEVYVPVHNPYLDQWFYTDPAYLWYRDVMLEMAADSDSETINCTGGGIVFGESISFAPLEQFLNDFSE